MFSISSSATRAHFRPRTVFAVSGPAFSAAFAKLSLEVPCEPHPGDTLRQTMLHNYIRRLLLTVDELMVFCRATRKIALPPRRRLGRICRENRKGCDIGYVLAVGSCEGVNDEEHAPSQPLMRPLLSQFQTSTASREDCRFFRVCSPSRSPHRADRPAYFGLAAD